MHGCGPSWGSQKSTLRYHSSSGAGEAGVVFVLKLSLDVFIGIGVLPEGVYVHLCRPGACRMSKEDVRSPGTGATDDCESPHGC